MYSSMRRTTSPEAKKRRFHGSSACSPCLAFELGEAARIGRVGARHEVVEDAPELLRRHALVLAQLEIEVVVEAQGAGKAVAQLHQVQEAVVQHPPLDLAEALEGAAAALFHRIGGLIGGQHAERRDLRLARAR